jgi:hypothetical protein
VEIYRRKSTIPAISRSLIDIGWQGRIEETFHLLTAQHRWCAWPARI